MQYILAEAGQALGVTLDNINAYNAMLLLPHM